MNGQVPRNCSLIFKCFIQIPFRPLCYPHNKVSYQNTPRFSESVCPGWVRVSMSFRFTQWQCEKQKRNFKNRTQSSHWLTQQKKAYTKTVLTAVLVEQICCLNMFCVPLNSLECRVYQNLSLKWFTWLQKNKTMESQQTANWIFKENSIELVFCSSQLHSTRFSLARRSAF